MYKYAPSSVKGKTWQIGATKRDGKVVGSAIEGTVNRTEEVAKEAVLKKLKELKYLKED